VTPEQLTLVERHLTTIRAAVPGLPIPQIEPCDDDDSGVRLVWSRAGWIADVWLHADGTHEWFWRDRVADAYDGTSGPEGDSISARLLLYLREVGR
jgi:hypothetical protein